RLLDLVRGGADAMIVKGDQCAVMGLDDLGGCNGCKAALVALPIAAERQNFALQPFAGDRAAQNGNEALACRGALNFDGPTQFEPDRTQLSKIRRPVQQTFIPLEPMRGICPVRPL